MAKYYALLSATWKVLYLWSEYLWLDQSQPDCIVQLSLLFGYQSSSIAQLFAPLEKNTLLYLVGVVVGWCHLTCQKSLGRSAWAAKVLRSVKASSSEESSSEEVSSPDKDPVRVVAFILDDLSPEKNRDSIFKLHCSRTERISGKKVHPLAVY